MCLDDHRYLKSIVETILIYQHFKKLTPEQHTAKQELVDFWMDFLVEATKTDVSVVRFPVSDCFVGGVLFCLINGGVKEINTKHSLFLGCQTIDCLSREEFIWPAY